MSAALSDAELELAGARYMRDAKGALVPLEVVKPAHKLQDQVVRDLAARALELEAVIGTFKGRAFDDVEALLQALAERYGSRLGGAKGNLTLYSYDGLIRVQVQVADLIKFGPELQIAKALVDACVAKWSEGARAELRAIVLNAFQVDKEGQVNRGALISLQRLEIEDEDWQAAMAAISDSVQVIGTKRYIRFARRPDPKAMWQEISLNIATAAIPDAGEPG